MNSALIWLLESGGEFDCTVSNVGRGLADEGRADSEHDGPGFDKVGGVLW